MILLIVLFKFVASFTLTNHIANMNTICINSRDELNLIDLDLVACVKADGNYSNIMYIEGYKLMITLGLTQLLNIINLSFSKRGGVNPFVRLGRSVIINSRFLTQINLQQQRLTLSDGGKHSYQLTVPKQMLREYKDLLRKQYENNK